jgi:hypothetical protein
MNTELKSKRANNDGHDNKAIEASLVEVLGCPAAEFGVGLLLMVNDDLLEPRRSLAMSRLMTPIADDRCQLIDILAWNLLNSSATTWPGSDGLTVEDVVVADYRMEAEAGHVPQPDDLITLYPNLSEAIRTFFRCG